MCTLQARYVFLQIVLGRGLGSVLLDRRDSAVWSDRKWKAVFQVDARVIENCRCERSQIHSLQGCGQELGKKEGRQCTQQFKLSI